MDMFGCQLPAIYKRTFQSQQLSYLLIEMVAPFLAKERKCFQRTNFSEDFMTWLWHAKMMDAHSEIFQWTDLYFQLDTVLLFCFVFGKNQTLGCKSGLPGSVLRLTAILCIWHFIAFNLTLCGMLFYLIIQKIYLPNNIEISVRIDQVLECIHILEGSLQIWALRRHLIKIIEWTNELEEKWK